MGGLSREEIARREVGVTTVSRPVALTCVLFFLAVIYLVPVAQRFLDSPTWTAPAWVGSEPASAGPIGRIRQQNHEVLRWIKDTEGALEESFLRRFFLPPLQQLYAGRMEQGNEKVVVGRDGWLFYRPGLEYITGQSFLSSHHQQVRAAAHALWEQPLQPDPVAAISRFGEQLAERGIELVLLPVPMKASLLPEKLSVRSDNQQPVNRARSEFLTTIQEKGVRVFDPLPLLQAYQQQGQDSYLQTDTHWTPGGMQQVAIALADYLGKDFPELTGQVSYQSQEVKVAAIGDIAKMLTLPEGSELYGPQEVVVNQVVSGQEELWQADPHAQLLLLGDSFTNIYSTSGLGWGTGAGLAEQLSLALQGPVDVLARNDAGAHATREMLATELARGRDRLAGKKVVVWQFAERELFFGDWRETPLVLGDVTVSEFFTAEPGGKVAVTASVAAVSRSPRPGSVPYRDNIITLHLVDLQLAGEAEEAGGGQAVVYVWGMQDNVLSDFTAVRPGDRLSLWLQSWEEVETEYGSYRRSALDDEMLELELPNWGVRR